MGIALLVACFTDSPSLQKLQLSISWPSVYLLLTSATSTSSNRSPATIRGPSFFTLRLKLSRAFFLGSLALPDSHTKSGRVWLRETTSWEDHSFPCSIRQSQNTHQLASLTSKFEFKFKCVHMLVRTVCV